MREKWLGVLNKALEVLDGEHSKDLSKMMLKASDLSEEDAKDLRYTEEDIENIKDYYGGVCDAIQNVVDFLEETKFEDDEACVCVQKSLHGVSEDDLTPMGVVIDTMSVFLERTTDNQTISEFVWDLVNVCNDDEFAYNADCTIEIERKRFQSAIEALENL